jgi:hypothetical protein
LSIIILAVGIGVLLFRLKSNIETVTYYDGVFYDKSINPKYYFFERVGIDYEKLKEIGGRKQYMTNEVNLNSTRVLKDDPEDVNKPENVPKGNVLVLKENKDIKDIKDVEKLAPDVQNNYVKTESERGEETKKANTEYKYVTYNDFTMLPRNILYTYDIREFYKYFTDELTYHHSIAKVIWKDSFIETRLLSYIKLITRINITCAANAFTLTDSYIEERASYTNRVICINNHRIASHTP